jgi:hypothetical protein
VDSMCLLLAIGSCSGNSSTDARRNGRTTSALLVSWGAFNHRVDVCRGEGAGGGCELGTREVGRGKLHHGVEGLVGSYVWKRSVETSVFVSDIGGFGTNWHGGLWGGDWLVGDASITVVAVAM